MVKWLSLFKFSWLRKCKVCRVRGTKCMCKRPSLALEHIFFLEERKNKFGARNFSHVSDTMVTSASTLNSTNNTVLMRGSSFGDEYAFVDYYYNPSQSNGGAAPAAAAAGASTAPRQSLTGSGGRSSHSSRGSGSRGSLDKKKGSGGSAQPTTTTTIVRKNSGRMVPSSAARRRFEELPNEYTLYSDHTTSSIAKTTTPSSFRGSSRRRPLRLQSNGSVGSKRKEETGCSFKFYGRGGHSSSVSTSASTFNSSRGPLNSGRGFGSKNDSLLLSSSATSSVRMSAASDRMSVDNNFGSYNPRGMFIENPYSPSIQEDGDDSESEALQQLSGWLQASPTSTAGSFAAPRNIHCF